MGRIGRLSRRLQSTSRLGQRLHFRRKQPSCQTFGIELFQHLGGREQIDRRPFEKRAVHPPHCLHHIPCDPAGKTRTSLDMRLSLCLYFLSAGKNTDAVFQQPLQNAVGDLIVLIEAFRLEAILHQVLPLPIFGIPDIDAHMGDVSQIQGVDVLTGRTAVGAVFTAPQRNKTCAIPNGILQILSGAKGLVTGKDHPAFSFAQVLQQISLVLLKVVPAAQHQQFALPVGGESAAQVFQRVTQQILIQRNFPRGGQQLVQAEKGLDLAVLPEGLHYSEQVAIALYLILLCA